MILRMPRWRKNTVYERNRGSIWISDAPTRMAFFMIMSTISASSSTLSIEVSSFSRVMPSMKFERSAGDSDTNTSFLSG